MTTDNAYTGPERRTRASPPAEVRLTDETIDYIEQRVQAAVAKAIQNAMTEDTAAAFWSAGVNVLQRQATQHAGRIALGGIKAVLSKGALFLLLGGVVYAIGGWQALAKLAKVLFAPGA